MKYRQNQKSHGKRKQQEINEAYKPNSVPNAFFFYKASSEESSRQPSEAAGASFASVAATAAKPAQNDVDYDCVQNQVEPAVDYCEEKNAKKRDENPCNKRKISQNG